MDHVKITNQYLDQVKWTNSKNCRYLLNKQTDVWKINISPNLYLVNSLIPVLTIGEIDRANRFLRPDDRNRSIISRAALRIILGKYLRMSPALVEIDAAENKKPFLKHPERKDIFFNLSHSGDWILLAVSEAEVGVDIEYINAQFKYLDILPDYFNEEEVKFIRQNLSDDRFFMHWTRKEALSKALGTGLDSLLKVFPSLNGDHFISKVLIPTHNNWQINSFYLNSNYITSLANNEFIEESRYWEFAF